MKEKSAAVLIAFQVALVLSTGAFAFPTVYPEGVTIHEQDVAEGYVIYGARDGTVYLVDDVGNVDHTWSAPCGWQGPQQALAGGHILTGNCSSLVELDWSGAVVWQYTAPPGVEIHHDWERLPDGNTLILCRETISDPSISDEAFLEDFLVEVSPAGAVVWEWREADHFDEFFFSQQRRDQIRERGGDWSHATSVASISDDTSHGDPRFSPGNIVIALRHQNTLAVIDRTTGQIVWVLTDQVIGPHDARMITDDLPGGGNILVFDNGYAEDWSFVANRDHSRVVEVDPVSVTLPYTYRDLDSGQLKGAFFNYADGGAQRLSNGNTLITEASFGRIFEVTTVGQIVWEYIIPFRHPVDGFNGTYRARKVPFDWARPHFAPDLVVSGVGAPDPVQPEGDLTYTFQLTNSGADPALETDFVTAIPAGTAFLSFDPAAGWSCTSPSPGGTGPIHCTRPRLTAGTMEEFGLVVRAGECLDDLTTISITVTVSSTGNDADPGDNSATIDIPGASGAAPIDDLAAALIGGGQDVQLNWGEVSPACGSRVLRSTVPDSGFADVSGALGGNAFVDVGAGSSAESYYYLVAIADAP